jgi:hypothetical protein
MTGLGAVTAETPQWQPGRRGGIQIEPKALFSLRTLTLYRQQQSSPFWARDRDYGDDFRKATSDSSNHSAP